MLKRINSYSGSYAHLYFWRTHEQQEIDLIEERDGVLRAFEFKWNSKAKSKPPKSFSGTYPDSTYEIITPENFWEFTK